VSSFLKRLFQKKISSLGRERVSEREPGQREKFIPKPLAEVAQSELTVSTETRPHLQTPQLTVGVAQSVGIERDNNEDSIFTLTTSLLVDLRVITFGLYIIADGMGGHDNGELASRLAVDGLASHVINSLYLPIISSSDMKLEFSLHEMMREGILQAHQAIKKHTDGGGTTLTAALILGDQLTITHVGDSRAYYIDPLGEMKQLTRDHSLVKRLEEIGQITAEQALTDPRRNVLYRALGQGEPFEPDITSMQVCPGCQLLICSDGLWGVIPQDDLSMMVNSSLEPQYVCQAMVQAANQAGGPDNISAIIVRLPG
jgi:serine/threonine protein phosphatase PrpC